MSKLIDSNNMTVDILSPPPQSGLPVVDNGDTNNPLTGDRPDTRKSAATGTTAASIRAVMQQFISFYFRAPIKAFFRTRFDYTAYVRAVLNSQLPDGPEIRHSTASRRDALPSVYSSSSSSATYTWMERLKMTTPALLTRVVRQHGWSILPNQVLPPLLANVFVGALLYTSYLQSLSIFHSRELGAKIHPQPRQSTAYTTTKPSSSPESNQSGFIAPLGTHQTVVPPPSGKAVFYAGLTAGCIQTLGAAPLDALQLRFRMSELQATKVKGQPNMWLYAWDKLRTIGPAGIFAGFGLSALKDGLGYGIFFAVFEVTKTQAYMGFVNKLVYWKGISPFTSMETKARKRQEQPHYLIEPAFLLLAGATATIAQQVIVHPLSRIQQVHLRQLETLDCQAAAQRVASAAAAATAAAEAQVRGTTAAATTTSTHIRVLNSIGRVISSTTEIATRPLDGRLHTMRLYYRAYASTFQDCAHLVRRLQVTDRIRERNIQQQLLENGKIIESASIADTKLPSIQNSSSNKTTRARRLFLTSTSTAFDTLTPDAISRFVSRVSTMNTNLKHRLKTSLPAAASTAHFLSSIPFPTAAASVAILKTRRSTRAWHSWLYRNFWTSTIRQVPSSSAGLIIFEIFRRKNVDYWVADNEDI